MNIKITNKNHKQWAQMSKTHLTDLSIKVATESNVTNPKFVGVNYIDDLVSLL